MNALPESPKVKWLFLVALLLSVVLAIASFRLLPDSNLPIALAAIVALLSFVELICELQEKRIRLVTSRALIVKSIRIFLTVTPLLLLRFLAPYALQFKGAEVVNSRPSGGSVAGTRYAANEAQIMLLETVDARFEKRLRVLEKRQ